MYLFIDALIPLLIAILLLVKPQIFTKKDLNDPANMKVKKRLSNSGKILVVAAVLLFIANLGSNTSGDNISAENLIKQIVLYGNEQLPKELDEFTTLDRMSGNENTIFYHYSLYGLDYSAFTEEEYIDIMKTNLISIAGEQEHIEGFRKKKIRLTHIYKDVETPFEAIVTLNPGEY